MSLLGWTSLVLHHHFSVPVSLLKWSLFPSSPGHLGETGFPPWLPPIWFLGSALPALTGLAGWKMNAGFMRRSPSPRTEQTKPDPDNKTLFNPPGEKRRKRKEDRALRKSGEDEHRYEKHCRSHAACYSDHCYHSTWTPWLTSTMNTHHSCNFGAERTAPFPKPRSPAFKRATKGTQ